MNNTEIFELCETSSKKQCPDCALFWEIGNAHCTCGRCLKSSHRTEELDKNNYDVSSILGYVLPSALSRNRARSSLSATASDPQTHIQQVPLPASLHLVVPKVQVRPPCLSRPMPGSLQYPVPRPFCVCELANVRDLTSSICSPILFRHSSVCWFLSFFAMFCHVSPCFAIFCIFVIFGFFEFLIFLNFWSLNFWSFNSFFLNFLGRPLALVGIVTNFEWTHYNLQFFYNHTRTRTNNQKKQKTEKQQKLKNRRIKFKVSKNQKFKNQKKNWQKWNNKKLSKKKIF